MQDEARKPISAVIISIGDELTKGEIANTNASYIARKLTDIGVKVNTIANLPDDSRTAVSVIRKLMKGEGVYLFTGGIGGTRDDITRPIIGRVLRRRLRVDEKGAGVLENWYKTKKRPFRKADRMQASCPEGGFLIGNPVGLAYGFCVRDAGRLVFSLPGVPREMTAMFDEGVLPLIEREAGESGRRTIVLTFAGIPEYTLDREIGRIVTKHPGVRYGTRSGYDVVRVVFESEEHPLEPCVEEIERAFAASFIARGGAGLGEALGGLLKAGGATLSTAESCTAGFLSKVITDVPGSSDYYLGGVVAYSDEAKRRLLDVSAGTLAAHGAVSRETAVEMAKGALSKFSSDLAVSVTGIAGPDGGSAQKPVGTVCICVAARGGSAAVEQNQFSGDRESVRHRSVNRALAMLIRHVRGGGP